MKRLIHGLFWVISLFPCLAFTQECSIEKETDPFTKEIRLTTGFMNLNNARLSIQADSREIDFLFIISGKDNCFSDASTASVFFEGTKVKVLIRNAGSMNCDGFFHFIFKNQVNLPSLLQKLASQKISGILFTGNDKKGTQVTFSTAQQTEFLRLTGCLLEEAKKLLPAGG